MLVRALLTWSVGEEDTKLMGSNSLNEVRRMSVAIHARCAGTRSGIVTPAPILSAWSLTLGTDGGKLWIWRLLDVTVR